MSLSILKDWGAFKNNRNHLPHTASLNPWFSMLHGWFHEHMMLKGSSCCPKQLSVLAGGNWGFTTLRQQNQLFATYLYHALPSHSAKAALHTQWPLPIKYELSVSALKFWKFSYISFYVPCTNCIKCANNQEAESICPHVKMFNFQNYWMGFIKFCSGIQHQKSSNKFGSSSYSSTVSTQNISILYNIYVTKI